MSDYNYMIDRIGETLAMIEIGCLSMKNMDFEDVKKFQECVTREKDKTLPLSGDEVMKMIKTEHPHIYEISKKVSTSEMLAMARTGKRDRRWMNANVRKYLQLGFCLMAMWTDDVLKDDFKYTEKEREEFFLQVRDLIYGYQHKMVTMEMMNQAFIDDFGVNVITGEVV